MAKNIVEIPFTEIVERASELARERAEIEKKVRGIVNDVYTREIPRKEDWSFLVANSAITFTERYNTGTVTANTGDTTVRFSSDVTITSAMTGRRMKISGNDFVYATSFAGTTSLAITPPFSGTQNVSSVSYEIFMPYYALAPDFDRFLKDKGLTKYQSGKKDFIPESDAKEFDELYSPTTENYPTRCRLYGIDTH